MAIRAALVSVFDFVYVTKTHLAISRCALPCACHVATNAFARRRCQRGGGGVKRGGWAVRFFQERIKTMIEVRGDGGDRRNREGGGVHVGVAHGHPKLVSHEHIAVGKPREKNEMS